jgi:uncharacterized protein (DUF2062 family)
MISIRKTARRIERFVVLRVLHADDTPHRLALGIALGMFIALTPTMGFQIVLVLLLAPFIRANGRVGVPMVLITNPFTMVPIYGFNYWLGYHLLSIFGERPGLNIEKVKNTIGNLQIWNYVFKHFYEAQFWHSLWCLFIKFLNVSLDLWIGSIIVGLFLAAISYVVSYKLIVWYRSHNPIIRLRLRRKLLAKKERNLCPNTTKNKPQNL